MICVALQTEKHEMWGWMRKDGLVQALWPMRHFKVQRTHGQFWFPCAGSFLLPRQNFVHISIEHLVSGNVALWLSGHSMCVDLVSDLCSVVGFGYVAHRSCCIADDSAASLCVCAQIWVLGKLHMGCVALQQKTHGNVKAKIAEQNQCSKADGECTVLPCSRWGSHKL